MSIFEESAGYRPFKYPFAVDAAQKHAIDMFWDVHQVELQEDLRQYNSADGLATDNVPHHINKRIIDKVLCLFTEMDKVVGASYTKLIPHIGNNEIRNLLITQTAREVVHQRAYALLAETFGFSDSDWVEFREYVEMQDKLDLMSESEELTGKLDCAKLLAKILLGEGIGLFAAFACLLNFKRQGLLVGFNDVNAWSLVDEAFHVEHNIKILDCIRDELSEVENIELDKYIEALSAEYIEAEIKFIDLVFLLGDQEDLTKEDLCEYIHYLRDLRLYQLGLLSHTEVRENPLKWMEWLIGAKKHSNFFEKRVTDYSHNKLIGDIDYDRYKD